MQNSGAVSATSGRAAGRAGKAAGRPGKAGRSGRAGGAAETQARPRRRPEKLYRIGEVTDYSGLSRQTVHNYTIMGLLHEAKWTEGGHRLYDEAVFARLDLIADLKNQGKSLGDIREHCAKLDAARPPRATGKDK